MDTLLVLLYSFGAAAIIFFFIWQRKNKLVFAIMWFLTVALVFNAIGQGCGESLGRQYLKKTGELTPQQKKMKDYYYGNLSDTWTSQAPAKTETPPPEPQKTWFWSLLGLLFLINALVVSIVRAAEISAAAGKTLVQGLSEFIKTGGKGFGAILKGLGRFVEEKYDDIKDALKKHHEDSHAYRLAKLKSQTEAAPKSKEKDDLSFFQRYFPSFAADGSWAFVSQILKKPLLKIFPRFASWFK